MADVYVVTTVAGRQPPSLRQEDGQELGHAISTYGSTSVGFETVGDVNDVGAAMKSQSIGAIRSVSIDGTADEFCQNLERLLDRPVVNETHLKGEFEFRVDTFPGSKNDFLERLRDHLGLVIARAQKNIEFLVFVPR